MGDVGALALGSALALLALTLNTQLLLLLICGINVMEAGRSRSRWACSRRRGRKRRLFRMSPIHHHFELVGWPETTVIIRFWLICRRSAWRRRWRSSSPTSPASRAASMSERVAGVRPRRHRGGGRPRPATPRLRRSIVADDAVADDRSAQLRRRRSASSCTARPTTSWPSMLVAAATARRPAPGVPETHPSIRAALGRGVPVRQRDRARLRVGAGATRRAAADAGGHRHRRQDDHDAADGRDAARRRAAHGRRVGNTDVPLVDAIDDDARRVRRRVHELPPGVDRAASGPRPRRGSTSPPTTSTGTRRWRRYEASQGPDLVATSAPTTWRSASPTIRS